MLHNTNSTIKLGPETLMMDATMNVLLRRTSEFPESTENKYVKGLLHSLYTLTQVYSLMILIYLFPTLTRYRPCS